MDETFFDPFFVRRPSRGSCAAGRTIECNSISRSIAGWVEPWGALETIMIPPGSPSRVTVPKKPNRPLDTSIVNVIAPKYVDGESSNTRSTRLQNQQTSTILDGGLKQEVDETQQRRDYGSNPGILLGVVVPALEQLTPVLTNRWIRARI